MHRATERDPVSDGVWPLVLHRPDVRGLHLGPNSAIEDLDSGYRTGITIGFLHLSLKRRVAEGSLCHLLHDGSFDGVGRIANLRH